MAGSASGNPLAPARGWAIGIAALALAAVCAATASHRAASVMMLKTAVIYLTWSRG